ncbi:MAG: LysM peptidoglycan-binding domain-containing protein [Streptomyces sp.]|uniref:muramidase family protein n=1 Tax=Nocardioides sp. TaxID=35761 RepID=UPI001984B24B|nr:LysM peptidoglycan-binding domain-containing protein [Nocardioides sp.]MBC7268589.1 LysM peptidoglycan-binding domain-containing protein [Streptomyces sp.]MBC7278247.1 LysM peptidoglycan-binding domain-containing protein [Nocardioides sp.]
MAQAEPARKTHIVQPGETLSGIAEKYGVKAGDLATWNQIADPAKIRAGAKLVVSPPAKPAKKTYTVALGDTFSGIAKKFGVEVGELMAYNGYEDPTKLLAGSEIKIPAAKPKLKKYEVVAGDTFFSIGEKFGVTADELMAHNGYEDATKLLAGTTIEIPAKATKPKPKPKPQPGTGETVYTTVAGDTYASVAKKFRITEKALRSYNGTRSPDKLPPGYKLYIPSS